MWINSKNIKFLKCSGLLSVVVIITLGYRNAFTRTASSSDGFRPLLPFMEIPQRALLKSQNQLSYTDDAVTDEVGETNELTTTHFYVKEDKSAPKSEKQNHVIEAEKHSNKNATSGDKFAFQNVKIISNKSIIVINAYLRTGSTFTASLFETYPGAFYIFEPLHDVERGFRAAEAAKKDVFLQYINHSRNVTVSKRSSVYLEEVCSWLSCRLQDLSKTSLSETFLSKYNTKMKPFQNCMNTGNKKLTGSKYASALKSCLKKPLQDCNSSSFIVLKFIRMRIGELASLLPYFPNMKIVHLIRDPRGMFNSRYNLGYGKVQRDRSDKDAVHGYCRLLEEDLRHSKELSNTHPDKILVVQYENIAEDPYEWAKRLYKFAGMDYTKSTEEFIKRATSATKDTGTMQTQRKNSTATSIKWRTQLSSLRAVYIYNTCRKSMDILGYLPLTINTLRNMSVPSRHRVNVTSNILKLRNLR